MSSFKSLKYSKKMQGEDKTLKAASISWDYRSSKALFSAFKGTHPANQHFSVGQRGALERHQRVFWRVAADCSKDRDRKRGGKSPQAPFGSDEIIQEQEEEGSS